MPQSTHTPDNRNHSFVLKNRVIINGGYAGFGAPDPNFRDPAIHVTNLSGDIGTLGVRTDNSFTVVNGGVATTPDTIVNGVTIRDGYGGSSGVEIGGAGIKILLSMGNPSSPTFVNCIITRNWVDGSGGTPSVSGGLHVEGGSESQFEFYTFIDNESGEGGGVKIDEAGFLDTDVLFENCTFTNNLCINRGGGQPPSSTRPKRDSLAAS